MNNYLKATVGFIRRTVRPTDAPPAFKKQALDLYEATRGPLQLTELDGCPLVSYGEDIETYRAVQNLANAAKIQRVFAVESNIADVAAYCKRRMEPPFKVLCHGTRNGAELRWFAKTLNGADVLGTDIADSATRFPNTIQWDFHDIKDEWIGTFDIVYSNSWDHARDPELAFHNWMRSLKPTGVLLVEHSSNHESGDSPTDCFGATRDKLVALLNKVGDGEKCVCDAIEGLQPKEERRCVLVVGACGTEAEPMV